MPRTFSYKEFCLGSATVKAYADKHSPVIHCEPVAHRNAKFKINVTVGKTIAHPNTKEHHFSYVELWDLETLLAEIRFTPTTFGSKPIKAEVDFYVVPRVSMRLRALAYCSKHGLWESEEVFVKVIDEVL